MKKEIIEGIEENVDGVLEQEDLGQELYEHHKIVIDKGQSPERIDKFLVDRLMNTTRNRIQNAARAGNILVNDVAVKPNYKLRPDDIVSIVLPHPPNSDEILPEDIPLEIIYEDDDVIIINKKPGMVVHPGFGNFTGTLVNALAFYLKGKAYLVHRIDKNTSGVLMAAKNEISQSHLAKQFYDHTIERKYYALVWGDFKEDEGTIEGHIGRGLKDRKVMSVFPEGDYGKHAITHYKVIERFGYVSLVECVLETGRTHQIRCHMRYIKHPLFNDATYGGNAILKGTTFTRYKQFIQNCFNLIPRHSLHAAVLGFVHPTTNKLIRIEQPMPDDLAAVLDKWRAYCKTKALDEPEKLSEEEDRENRIVEGRLLNENK